jgi:cytochrome c biogenesis protein CcmG/thiol:disulfide interchange protein DsbE
MSPRISPQGRAGRLLVLAAAALIGALATGCGSSTSGGDYGGDHPSYAALQDAPKPLAQLYAQGDDLLGGGLEAFDSRLASLHGYPAVVNAWASWCGPCRQEFPHFQQAAASQGDRVAFLGVDSQDSTDAAKQFLGEFPVPYPSYEDPDRKITTSLHANFGLPSTVFYDSSGNVAYTKQGPYSSEEDLLADIKRYAR